MFKSARYLLMAPGRALRPIRSMNVRRALLRLLQKFLSRVDYWGFHFVRDNTCEGSCSGWHIEICEGSCDGCSDGCCDGSKVEICKGSGDGFCYSLCGKSDASIG